MPLKQEEFPKTTSGKIQRSQLKILSANLVDMNLYGQAWMIFVGRCQEKFKFSIIAYPDGLNDLNDPNDLNLRKALQKGAFDTRLLKVGT